MVKFEHYRQILLHARKQNNKPLEEKCNQILQKLDQRLVTLAYKEPSKEDYEEWVKETKKEKVIANNKKSISK